MKKAFRIFTLSLCVMVLCMLPIVSAYAAEFPSAPNTNTALKLEDGTCIALRTASASPVSDVLAGELTPLDNPSDLEWGVDHEYYDPETWEVTDKNTPGIISWKPGTTDQAVAELCIYQVGSDEPVYQTEWYFGSVSEVEWRSVDSFILADLGSGTYYFTITAIGDGITYSNSETMVSDTWTYVQPDKSLDPCTNLSWTDIEDVWEGTDTMYISTLFDGASGAAGYEVAFYYAKTAEDEPFEFVSTWGYGGAEDVLYFLDDMYIQENGSGYYYYKVRALSGNIEELCNSAWSELSPAYDITSISSDLAANLDSIISDSSTMEEKLSAVQNLNTQDLKTAMLADDTVVEKLAELETQIAGGAAPVNVADSAAAAFSADDISIVGANLNSAANANEDITLVIDKPAKDHIIEEVYDNAVAVKFSMTLDNVPNAQKLDVPVQITLPVPASINPNFLVILHYHPDGSYEELHPYIYTNAHGTYAEFVLTSFSDFVMTEYIPSVAMYRLYNPNSGEHFYTGSEEERDSLAALGWNYEGIAWYAPVAGGEPIYRLYNSNNGDHHYTGSAEERDNLVAVGWQYEGVAWNTPKTGIPLYRLYNPNADCGSHHYTGSAEERDNLVALGWQYEGIAWNGLAK